MLCSSSSTPCMNYWTQIRRLLIETRTDHGAAFRWLSWCLLKLKLFINMQHSFVHQTTTRETWMCTEIQTEPPRFDVYWSDSQWTQQFNVLKTPECLKGWMADKWLRVIKEKGNKTDVSRQERLVTYMLMVHCHRDITEAYFQFKKSIVIEFAMLREKT